MRLIDYLDKGAMLGPGSPCLTMGDIDLSYAEVQRISQRVARGLQRSGIAAGDKVAVLSGNDATAFACVVAAAFTTVTVRQVTRRTRPGPPRDPPGRVAKAGPLAPAGPVAPVRPVGPLGPLLFAPRPTALRLFRTGGQIGPINSQHAHRAPAAACRHGCNLGQNLLARRGHIQHTQAFRHPVGQLMHAGRA